MNLLFYEFQKIFLHQIAFCNDHHPELQIQELEDFQVLACLWHHRIIGGDDEHSQIIACGTCKHVAYKSFVAWNIHDSKFIIPKHQLRKTNINGHATPLLFGKTIGIHTRQLGNERSFTMVNMPRCTED